MARRRLACRCQPVLPAPTRWLLLAVLCIAMPVSAASAQRRSPADRFDDVFRKYAKRYFGVAFDWRIFKAQGMAESNLRPDAQSPVGARGIMQLMPSTFAEIRTKNPEIEKLDDPEWNIAAGIYYDRVLWQAWERDSIEGHRREFMFGSYNAGRGTIRKAQLAARADRLDYRVWPSIERVAPKVSRWRYRETLEYVQRIDSNITRLDGKGHVTRVGRRPPGGLR